MSLADYLTDINAEHRDALAGYREHSSSAGYSRVMSEKPTTSENQAISQENDSDEALDVMRSWFDTWNRGDLDAFADLYDVDAEVITDPSWMEPGPFKGRASIMQWYRGLQESWGGQETAIMRELFRAGESVVARLDWRVRGRSSGIQTQLDVTCVHLIENGRIIRQQHYFDYAKALEAVGSVE